MPVVLCFGDSNTWGSATVERPDGRYGPDERWPGVLQAELGHEWRVVEEGLPGRTTICDDPVEGVEMNARPYLLPCLLSHRPVDVFVVMLGSNNLKARFGMSGWEIAESVGTLLKIVRGSRTGPGGSAPRMIVVSPPPLLREMSPRLGPMMEGGYEKSLLFSEAYAHVAANHGAEFLDGGKVTTSSRFDGLHLDPEAHAALGRAVAERIAPKSR
ncbi:Lysophospholipase L1 [Faunimonas pinastri]|uniref:Lysophospholipase L1 n=1 Tax=Faunimonas pinastri TaxID=1855383 RepID=A0A1H9ARP9_9HYPH|nr:SGNH/GDSL hydrolase family protein [Faunimonas pinastri]SEP79201.1 Lysophospholipase L1 [Faunimonas pinastri]